MTLKKNLHAVALISSGLDSLLAAKIVQNQGIDIRGVCFVFGFDNLAERAEAGSVASLFRPFGIPVDVIDFSDIIVPIILNPRHGLGSAVNPCIDCHIAMLRRAKTIMDDMGARFLVTGEVVGQRPMSQTKQMLIHINKETDFGDLILRPLSAKLLQPTHPESEGWVDRDKLYDISGRSRKRQFALAEELGIKQFQSPAGGCILTEPTFSERVKAYWSHHGKEGVTAETFRLLRLGRHFWPRDHLHVIVGRDQKDNEALSAFAGGRWAFEAADTEKTPLVLAEHVHDDSDIRTAASITARYCSMRGDPFVRILCQKGMEEMIIEVNPASETDLESWRV